MSHDRYRSPLGTRYASPAMQSLWGEKHRIGLWRRLWLALAEGERELGVGVPAEAILVEDKSRNTHENAAFTKVLLQQQPQLKKLLLVTSAFHMRRAKGCFQKESIQADVYPADFYASDRSFDLTVILPQESSLANWRRLFHEMLGYVVYKVMGYC